MSEDAKMLEVERVSTMIVNQLKQTDLDAFENSHNLLALVVALMQLVEKSRGLTGKEKKASVLLAADTVIDQLFKGHTDLDEYKFLKLLLETTVQESIDFLIQVDKGKIQINPSVKKIYLKCWKCLKCLK